MPRIEPPYSYVRNDEIPIMTSNCETNPYSPNRIEVALEDGFQTKTTQNRVEETLSNDNLVPPSNRFQALEPGIGVNASAKKVHCADVSGYIHNARSRQEPLWRARPGFRNIVRIGALFGIDARQ